MGQKSKGAGIRSRGGFRHEAGRKRGEGSTRVSVPIGLLHEVRELIRSYKASSGALNAVGCNEGVSLDQIDPLVRKTNHSIEAGTPVPGSDSVHPRVGNTGITSTVSPEDALSMLRPFSSWQKRLVTLKDAPGSVRRIAIKDFGSLEQAAKENLAYNRKSRKIVMFDPAVFATLVAFVSPHP